MRTVLEPEQLRRLEADAIGRGVPGLLLMERAAQALTASLCDMLGGLRGRRVLFFCGRGNNGGDGLAAARLLRQAGGLPTVLLAGRPGTPDAQANLAYARALDIPCLEAGSGETGLPRAPGAPWDAAVDALLGTGLSRAPEGLTEALILSLNGLGLPVLSADVPSGMDAGSGRVPGACVRAARTVTFACPKPGLYLSPRRELAGEIRVADIGLPAGMEEEFFKGLGPERMLMPEEEDLASLLPERPLTAHKGNFGRVLLYAGSPGMAGAAALCAKACLRAGAGLVTLAGDPALFPAFHSLVPEATCVDLARALENPPEHDVLALGSGLGRGEAVWRAIRALFSPGIPSVWDADALNLLAMHPMPLGERAVLTPHPKEAAGLLGSGTGQVTDDLAGAARALHGRLGATVLLKSHSSLLWSREGRALVASGSQVLAKGGSGDVLCGITAALLAQMRGRPDAGFKAAMTASLWHGLAGRNAQKKAGLRSALATDLIDSLGEAAAFA